MARVQDFDTSRRWLADKVIIVELDEDSIPKGITLEQLKQRDTVFEEKNGTLESCLDNLKWILCDGLHRIATLKHIRARSDLDKKWVDNLLVSVTARRLGMRCHCCVRCVHQRCQ